MESSIHRRGFVRTSYVRRIRGPKKEFKYWRSLFDFGARAPQRAIASSFAWFLHHTQNDAPQSVGLLCTRDQPIAETSTRQNTHNGRTSMLTERFEPTFSAGERPQTYALDRAATGTGERHCCNIQNTCDIEIITLRGCYAAVDW